MGQARSDLDCADEVRPTCPVSISPGIESIRGSLLSLLPPHTRRQPLSNKKHGTPRFSPPTPSLGIVIRRAESSDPRCVMHPRPNGLQMRGRNSINRTKLQHFLGHTSRCGGTQKKKKEHVYLISGENNEQFILISTGEVGH